MTQATMYSIPWSQVYNATDTGMLGSVLGRYQDTMITVWQVAQRSMNWFMAITVTLLGFSTATPAVKAGCETAVSESSTSV